MGYTYERELKGILTADPDTLDKVTRSGSDEVVRAYRSIERAPFLVVRAAGSLGLADLVAMRGDIAFPIEVKAANRDVVHFSESAGALHEQALTLQAESRRAGLLGLYAFRRKGVRGDAWRLFSLPADDLTGRARILYGRIPDLPSTDAGNFMLRWEEGLPLHRFLSYLCPEGVTTDGGTVEPLSH